MAEGDVRGRSWYLSKEEIEQGSPSRRDGVRADKEARLRSTYCSFIRDVGVRLRLPQITIATGIVLCHRFYLHQSHVRNEWQIEDTPCQIERVVIVAHETMYKRKPDAARRINQKEVLEKRKDLILTGEALLLSTIRFDFNIQHPYEPLKLALKNLEISQKEVKQAAINLINDTLRTTLVLQFKPHYIAAGSLSLAAKFHDVKLPSEKGKVWWHQFDVAPKQLQAAIQQMKGLFMKRNPHLAGPAIRPIPAPAPVEKQQTVSSPEPAPVEKQQTVNSPEPAPVEKQQTVNSPEPAPVEKQQIISFPKPVLKYTYSRRGLRRAAPALVEKQLIISTMGPVSHAYSSRGGLNGTTTAPTVTPTPTLVKKQQNISTPDGPVSHAFSPRGVLNGPTSAPTITPNPVKMTISTPDSVLRHAHPSVGGVKRTRSPAQVRTLVKKQKIISAQDSVPPARVRTPVKKPQIISAQDSVPRHTRPSVGGERRPSTAPAPAPASALVRKQPTISTPDSVLRHTDPSRNEDSKPLRMHVDHSLSRTVKNGRPEKPSFQAALNAHHGHHVSSGPKDVNMTRVPNLVGQKRRIQEAAGEPPAPSDRCAGDASRRPQLKSLIVAPPSWKKQKVDV